MPVPTSQISPILSRRSLLWLGAAGMLAGVLSSFHATAVGAEEEKRAERDQKPLLVGGSILPMATMQGSRRMANALSF